MKKTVMGLLSIGYLYASPCEQIATLQKSYEKAPTATLLLKMGELASKMEVALEAYRQNSDYTKVCHLRIIKSDNYGDFIAYDGYHYRQIVKKFPQSDLIDDAKYHLIYISDEVNNYSDLNVEKTKLEAFIKSYPKSNLRTKAKKRITFIEEYLQRGGMSIID